MEMQHHSAPGGKAGTREHRADPPPGVLGSDRCRVCSTSPEMPAHNLYEKSPHEDAQALLPHAHALAAELMGKNSTGRTAPPRVRGSLPKTNSPTGLERFKAPLGKCHPSQEPGPRNQDQEQGSQNKTTLANQGLSASNSSPAPRWLSRLGTCRLLPGERSCKAICSVLPPPVPHKALSQLHTGRKTRTDLTTADTHKPRTRGSESRLWAEAPDLCPTEALQELQEPRSPPRLGADVCSWQKSGVFSITSLLPWFCGTAKISLSISELLLNRSVIPKS